MKCNCLERIKLAVKSKIEDEICCEVDSIEWSNTGIEITNGKFEIALYIPIDVKANAPGFRSLKGKRKSVFISFCPFCGVSIKENK